MRVLFPLLSLDNRGGTRVVVELANGLARRGHQVRIVAPRGAVSTTFCIDPLVEVRQVGVRIPQVEDVSSILRLPMLLPAIRQADVVAATYYLTAYPIALALALRRVRRAVYLIQHYEPLAFGEAERTFPRLKRVLAERTYRLPLRPVAVAHWIARRVREVGGQTAAVIRPGVDHDVFRPAPRTRNEGEALVFPGSDVWKGWGDFVAAVERVRTACPQLQVTAASRGPFPLPPGPYTGVHPQDDAELADLYRRATVYVHPAWWEGCPLSPLEAMACGTPVVAAASEGMLEYAVDGRNCLLVPPQDPLALAEGIGRVLGDEPLRERLRQGGLETAAGFTWERMVEQMEHFL
jgi:glycosyltransferase involved in cell wall biosynthesis